MDLLRPLVVATAIVTVAAVFVLASEIFLILFLGLLFGVFLTKVASWVDTKLPGNYHSALTVVVVLLLLVSAGTVTFFFVQINQQIEQARTKIDEGMAELGELVSKYPAIRSAAASTPMLSEALELQSRQAEDEQSEDERSEAEQSEDEQSEAEQSEDEQSEPGDPPSAAGVDSDASAAGDSRAGDREGLATQLSRIPEPVQQAASKIGQLFRTTFGLVINSVLIFFVGLFLAVAPTNYRDGIVRLAPLPKRPRTREVLDTLGETLWHWLIGRFASMLVTGLGAFLLLLALGVPMAGTLGILTGLLTFIPNIGAAVALVLAMLFALPEGTTAVISVTVGYILLQLIESYIVTPLIQRRAVSLPPALLIGFQAIMGVLFGIIGAIVASPILAVAKTLGEMLYIKDYLGDQDYQSDTH
ncbi:AI-2E family transporter [Roseimaritima sediminicola]|uniref:AI-2E family transporter n=1 Tax=Roseimaritima sediminicola TaxID=2662066 RepID=UPI00138682A5|nr:AI-2E family transporter [Roseimaritima sediminicola]